MSTENDEFDALAAQVADANLPIQWTVQPIVKFKDVTKRARQVSFLKAFAACGNVGEAVAAAGINRSTERAWRASNDKWYITQFKDAYEAYSDSIFKVVHERAIHGVEVPIVGKVQGPLGPEDKIIGYKPQYDNLLLMFLAKKVDPTFKEKHEDKKETEKPNESVSPMTRITIQLNMMEERQSQKSGFHLPSMFLNC